MTEPRLGGEVYNLEYYVSKAGELEAMGANTICIKYMAGIIAPYDAYEVVKALKAPIPGMIVRYSKQVGDAVSKGDTVVILEAMKMENALPAPAGGTVRAIHFSVGDSVAKDDVLCVIG
jgi:biotin carboxyl carrier protein